MDHKRTRPSSTPGDAAAPSASADADLALQHALDVAAAVAHAELARAGEGKSGVLLSWAGAAFGVMSTLLVTGSARFPGIERFGVISAILLLAIAVVLTLLTIRPVLPKHGGPQFLAYARAATEQALLDQIRAQLADPELSLARDAFVFSRMALTKHRYLRRAIDLILVAMVIITITVALPHLL
ncbi:Pycsar system effector family protein [Streptosporangium sp. CA-135522]|uniref:Pycsar system effector family protein n=1 Tax=Streptosporangium sp. CA-135522 TaxID=3240072 RepID=UPI003D94EAF2